MWYLFNTHRLYIYVLYRHKNLIMLTITVKTFYDHFCKKSLKKLFLCDSKMFMIFFFAMVVHVQPMFLSVKDLYMQSFKV